jgi:hypothetical protein
MQPDYDPFSNDVIHGDSHAIYRRLRDESSLERYATEFVQGYSSMTVEWQP